jgi:cyclic beta-1,2-glucan synthetase
MVGGPLFAAVVAALLIVLPASELAIGLVNHWVMNRFKPHILPRLDYSSGVPAGCPTMVVVPCMLVNPDEVNDLLDRLEMHYLANPDGQLKFALLTDFRDAASEHLPADKHLLEQATHGVRKLNERYQTVSPDVTRASNDRQSGSDHSRRKGSAPDASPTRFYLFHRARKWNPVERVWMGWERKRGKLIEFNRWLYGKTDASHTVFPPAECSHPPTVKYVITLDSDTRLPHGAARKLISTLEHPLNRPRCIVTPQGRQVAEGYTLLQPRVSVSLSGAHRSRYTWLFGGGAGVDPYVTASSDVYQDLFHEGSFVGKGIYDVSAFHSILDETFPENQILSHDLIEGCHARVGLVSDVELIDNYPSRYDTDARRQHRWVRGDWQLLPWLFPRAPTARGWRDNRLSVISWWKVFDNLRRSLVPAALLVLMVAGWTILPGPSWVWTLVALAVPVLPLAMELKCLLRGRPRAVTWREHLSAAASRIGRTVGQTLLTVAFLPHRAQLMIDAAVRSLIRTWWTRRGLLEWECAAAAERRVAGSFWSCLRETIVSPIFAIAILVLGVRGGLKNDAPLAAAPLLAAWIVSPLAACWMGRSLSALPDPLSPERLRWLWQIARDTWGYLRSHAGPADHFLPIDNVQEEPTYKLARRVSPTNEGLYLACAVAACDLGFITPVELAELLESNLDTWDGLEVYKGHPFNWYDTETLKPLSPRYVSTVDSGNLAAALLTVEQGLRDIARHSARSTCLRLTRLADRCERLARRFDFVFLYDSQRRLFHIGYNADTELLDQGHYDLLASEARLASYIAIARGDIDHRHWFQMGRPVTRFEGLSCLLSWGGGMFEYLMPSLFLRNCPGSLLDQTCRAAVARQIEYGIQCGTPWGISESCRAVLNGSGDYHYQSYGTPGLGLRRGLECDLVIAPYASLMALSIAPGAVANNLELLDRDGALSSRGFYDSVDYGSELSPVARELSPPEPPTRVPSEAAPSIRRGTVARCHMAHHQGMILLALANYLRDGRIQEWFHANASIRAAELILQERPPEGACPKRSSAEAVPTPESVYHSPPQVEPADAAGAESLT